MKRTPLYSAHQAAGAKLIEFGGWEMPVYYSSITEEHLAVRKAGGIFDISHMGEIRVEGADAERFLNHALTNDVSKLTPGWGQYSLMCNEHGGTVDDLYVYRLAKEKFLLIVNASRIEADYEWLKQLQRSAQSVELHNESADMGAVAVQGPAVRGFMDQVVPGNSTDGLTGTCSTLKKNEVAHYAFGAYAILVASTGYTGEDGFEIVAPAAQIEEVWNKVLEVGQAHGLKPCGLGARDTLRTEMCYPLYGHELDDATGPLEAGVGFFVQFDKPDFVGRAALLRQKTEGVPKKLVAFRMTQRSAPPRAHYEILATGTAGGRIGIVSSGTQSPSLGAGIGLGFVHPSSAKAGTSIDIDIRGKRAPAELVPKPIYRKPQ